MQSISRFLLIVEIELDTNSVEEETQQPDN